MDDCRLYLYRMIELETVFHTGYRGTQLSFSAHVKDAVNVLVEHAKAPSTIVVSVFTPARTTTIHFFRQPAMYH